jgi:glutamate carboxypeptidase
VSKYDFKELAEVIDINSYTKNKAGVDRVGEVFKRHLKALGFECRVYKREEIGNHLLFTSKKVSGKKILLLGHLDTVFPPSSFEGFREDDEWIYGPGVCDMKGGLFVALEALREVKKRCKEIKNIDFFMVSDEETGSDDSKFVSKELAKEYDYTLVFEAAGIEDEVVVARKGVGTFFIDIKGKAAHAGNNYDKGYNANLEAAHKTIALHELTDLSAGTTVNVGKIEGGIGANTISPHAKLTLEIRYTNTNERDRVLQKLHEITHENSIEGVSSTLSGGIQRDVMQSSQKTLEFVKELEKITSTTFKTESRGGVSDANIFSSNGSITLDGFGPFGDGDHTIHERAKKSSYLNRIELVSKILIHYNGK